MEKEQKRKPKNYGIKVKKTKKNNIIFTSDSKTIMIELKNVYLKFGIEEYNGKNILNIYVDKESDDYTNEDYNNIMDVCNYVKKVQKLGDDFMESRKLGLAGKGFQSPLKNIKEHGKKILSIRTYLDYNIDISLDGSFGSLESDYDMTGYKADVVINIKTLWTTDNNYGTIIYTSNVKLLKKV
jgi:hypothetical protein